jgi:Ser/Thr protein kinase RdoA (MazF antagonist)
MSVILFAKEAVYQDLADAFEDLKHVVLYRSGDDECFYQALRRLYFANVAAFLCQYHDDSPLRAGELSSIDPFIELTGKQHPERSLGDSAHAFLAAWDSLRYNLTTNDGEAYKAAQSYAFLDNLALTLSREVLKRQQTTK